MLRTGEVNPLNVHGIRRVDYCPPHFTSVEFDLATDEKAISDWIFTHLTGRFFYGDHVSIDSQGRRSMSKKVAFEIGSEASYFGLFIDQVNTRANNLLF